MYVNSQALLTIHPWHNLQTCLNIARILLVPIAPAQLRNNSGPLNTMRPVYWILMIWHLMPRRRPKEVSDVWLSEYMSCPESCVWYGLPLLQLGLHIAWFNITQYCMQHYSNKAKHTIDFDLKTSIPYLTIMGKLWGACYEPFNLYW